MGDKDKINKSTLPGLTTALHSTKILKLKVVNPNQD